MMDTDYVPCVVERDGGPDLAFRGRLLGEVSSDRSGAQEMWTELRVWQTRGGRFVCEVRKVSTRQGHRDRCRAAVVDGLDGVREFFGHNGLAKDLYREAGIGDVVEVE